MTNTVHGPFVPINVVSGSTPANATWGNNAQTQADAALHGFNPDLIGTGFVLSGVTCAKDGTIANQLDIASGRAYAVLSDGTLGLIVVGTDNTHTTATPSTTYHLYLQPDGTWYWSTSNSPAANSLHICDVTTDASGNISTVTDQRVMVATLQPSVKFSGIGGQATVGSLGAPVIMAQLINSHITSTAGAYILQSTCTADGLYRAQLTFSYQNPTPQKVTAQASWHDPNLGGTPTLASFLALSGGTGVPGELLSGTQATAMGNNQSVGCAPITFYAQSGTVNAIYFQDPGGTPNDYVTAIIERLS